MIVKHNRKAKKGKTILWLLTVTFSENISYQDKILIMGEAIAIEYFQ